MGYSVTREWLQERSTEHPGPHGRGTCWAWDRYSTEAGQPQCCIAGDEGEKRKTLMVRRLAWKLHNRREPNPKRWVGACRGCCEGCVRPEHMVARTRGAAMTGNTRSLQFKASMVSTKRARSKVSQDAIRSARAEGGTVDEVAARLGVTRSYAWAIMAGKKRREVMSVFGGLGG